MSDVKGAYAVIAKEVEEVQFLRDTVVEQVIQTFEREHPRLANLAYSGTRNRKCAAFWVCRRLWQLDGRSANQPLAKGDEDSLRGLL